MERTVIFNHIYKNLPKNKQERVGRLERQLGHFLASQGFTVQPQTSVEGWDGKFKQQYWVDFKLTHTDYPNTSLYVEFDELSHLSRTPGQKLYDQNRLAHLNAAGYNILVLAYYQSEFTEGSKAELLKQVFDCFDEKFIRSAGQWATRLTLVHQNYLQKLERRELNKKLDMLLYCTTDDENCTVDGAEI